MTRTIDEILADAKQEIDAIVNAKVWQPQSALGHLLMVAAEHQVVLEEVWERLQTVVRAMLKEDGS